MKRKMNLGAIGLFYLIAVLCRYTAVKTSLFENISNEYILILLRGIGPALGAITALLAFRIPLRMSLNGRYRNLWLPLCVYWLLPIALISTIYYLQNGSVQPLLLFTVLVYGLLEEIGWRGFLQEQLKDLPKIYSILIITLLWFAWHLNFQLSASNLVFFAIILAGTWGIGKVYDKTFSLLAVAGFHSLNNFFRTGLHGTEITIIAILLAIWIIFIVRYGRSFQNFAPTDLT
jgi:membrane protease YdiL (CAAX protease family)